MRLFLSVFVFSILFTQFAFGALPTDEIAAVRERSLAGDGAVSASDKAVMDKFLRSAIDAMFLSDTSEQTAKIRRQILNQKGKQDLSMYASTYLSIIRDHLRTAFEALDRIGDPEKKQTMTRNLVILTAEMRSLLLAEFGLEYLKDEDLITRYWAVKSIAGDAIVSQLNDDVANVPETAAKIYEALSPMAEQDNSPQIQELLIRYAGGWKDDRAAEMLSMIAQKRIAAYQDWSVQNVWLDKVLLESLAAKYSIRQLQAEKAQAARQFAELYSLAVQRWNMGKESLSPVEREQLIALIVEVDQTVLGSLGVTGTRLKTALERNTGLDREFEDLFGNSTKAGELANKLKFTYEGGATAPPKLSPPPAAQVTKVSGETTGG